MKFLILLINFWSRISIPSLSCLRFCRLSDVLMCVYQVPHGGSTECLCFEKRHYGEVFVVQRAPEKGLASQFHYPVQQACGDVSSGDVSSGDSEAKGDPICFDKSTNGAHDRCQVPYVWTITWPLPLQGDCLEGELQLRPVSVEA